MCRRKRKATRRVKEDREETSCGDSETEEEVNMIDRYRGWPGTTTKAKGRIVRHIATEHFKAPGTDGARKATKSWSSRTRSGRGQDGRCRCRTMARAVTRTMAMRQVQRDTTGLGQSARGLLNKDMTSTWLTPRARAQSVLNKAMTSSWSTPRATARCELNEAMTSSWV